jgi:tyrosinase
MLVQKPFDSGKPLGGGGSTTTSKPSTEGGTLIRENQSSLSDGEWDCLIAAMEALKKDKGNRNWDYFTELHKTYGRHEDHLALPHLDGEDLMIHSPFYWLPWHRKFIREFEKRLRAFESVTIPYWNWVTYRCIPEELKKKVFGWMQVARAVFHNGDKLPTANDYASVTGATSYSSFDYRLRELHAEVHNWVGGEMANIEKSPNDPLFFLHHAFIDRTWHNWAMAHPTIAFPSEYLDFELPPWGTKVREVLEMDDLGYEYK